MQSRRLRTRPEIQKHQLNRLQELLQTIAGLNPFYGERLRQAGLESGVADLEGFKRRMPFTLKAELEEDQRECPPYGTNLTYPLEAYSRFCQTSGTTRAPLRWLDTPHSWDWMVGCWRQVFERARITTADRLFFAFSFAPFLGFWTAFDAASRLGCLCIPGGGLSSVSRLSMMLENRVTVLLCTPTYCLRLGEVAREQGLDPGQIPLHSILVAGEPGGSIPAVQERIREVWPQVRVLDHHGMTEIGPVSYPCPTEHGRLHVLESDYIAEVLEPGGAVPVAGGQTGELVLTNLGRVGSPLIRYRSGDLVRTPEEPHCSCGSWEQAFQGGILCRQDDMVVIRGINVYPSAIEEVLRSAREVEEYRVEIDTSSAMPGLRIIVELSSTRGEAEDLKSGIENELRKTFALRIPVEVVAVGSLPRFEMKAKRWIRK